MRKFKVNSNLDIERYKYEKDEIYWMEINVPIAFVNNDFFVIRTGENSVEIFDLENKKSVYLSPQDLKGNWILDIKAIPNTNLFEIQSHDDVVKLWKINSDSEVKPIQSFQGHQNQIMSINMSPDGKKIASASKDKIVKIWDIDGTLLYNFNKHNEAVNSVKFSPDGQLIASGGDDKKVKLWNPENGTVIRSFEEHGNGITDISFSPDGKLIGSASKDNTMKLWNPENGKVLANFPHNHPILSVDFHPTQKLIATATDQNIKLWNYDGVLIKEYQRLGSHDVKFTPDGKSIAAGGNNYIPIWDFDLDRLIEKGCNWARDYLKNNINVEKRDRKLCDGIGDEETAI